MKRARVVVPGVVAALLLVAAWVVHARFRHDLALASAHAAQGSRVIETRCGPIEVQQAGEGLPLLIVHGSGGGHDQGMDYARAFVPYGIRVIAMSRFGYLRTPRPADASPQAQADAHVCVLDALGIGRAAVMGVSAGAPSALQTAIRHPDRVSALVLVVPITPPPAPSAEPAAPGTAAAAAPPAVSDAKDAWLLRRLGSDLLVWTMLHVARDAFFEHVLATPPALVHAASDAERARVNAMALHVLPVSARAAGLVDDTRLGKSLSAYPLESIRAPTLAISARDDGFGTFAGAQHVASRIPGARFIGYERGGHLLVGRDNEMRRTIVDWLQAVSAPADGVHNTRN
jgi:2-hydroxy-6-oxonona-2,4-dienedioate hydrolase